MRLTFTVVDPLARRRADVVLDAEPEPVGLVELRVVSGPDAGGVFRLDPGVARIGGDPGASVGIEDPSLPATAVTVEIAFDGTAAVTPRTDLPTWLNGERLAGPAPWPLGGQLAVGWTVLELAAPAYLLVRLGTGDLPSQVVLNDPTREEHRRAVAWTALDAPVTVPLRESGVLGIAGPAETARALARWVLAQAAVLHSPQDLQIYLLTDASARRP